MRTWYDEDPTTPDRCGSMQGSMRCVGPPDHYGPHWANFEGNRALRWGVVEIGCCDNECNRGPDHEGHHRDGKGRSWVYLTNEELAESEREFEKVDR